VKWLAMAMGVSNSFGFISFRFISISLPSLFLSMRLCKFPFIKSKFNIGHAKHDEIRRHGPKARGEGRLALFLFDLDQKRGGDKLARNS